MTEVRRTGQRKWGPQARRQGVEEGAKLWRNLMFGLSNKPTLTRVIGAAQIAGGIYWALKQEKMD